MPQFLKKPLGLCPSVSLSMWVMFSMHGFLKHDGYVPSDSSIFEQFISSLTMGLANFANSFASGTSFIGKKRKDFYLDHFPPYYQDSNKKELLKAPLAAAKSLLQDSNIQNMISVVQTSSNLYSQQAMVELALKASLRSRSPCRSPQCSRFRPRSPRTPPNRSPKRVRFDSKIQSWVEVEGLDL